MKISRYTKELLILFGIVAIISVGIIGRFGLTLGIDFTGGAFTEVSYTVAPEKQVVTDALTALGTDFGTYSLRGTEGGYMLRTRDLTESDRAHIHGALLGLGEGAQITRFTSIGPVIGEELKDKSVWAMGIIAAIIALYIMFAFRAVQGVVHGGTYGIITIITLIQDLLLPTALMAFLGYSLGLEVDTLFITALMAILGYSVNNTVVVFDRVREHLSLDAARVAEDAHAKATPFAELVDISVRESLGRTINTSLTVIIALAALYFFGGSVTQTFSLILIVGVIAGIYSSLFVAAPLLIKAAERAEKKATA